MKLTKQQASEVEELYECRHMAIKYDKLWGNAMDVQANDQFSAEYRKYNDRAKELAKKLGL